MTNTLRNASLILSAALLAACGDTSSSRTIGPAGGTVSTASGVTLKVAPGAVATETEIEIVDVAPRHGEQRRIELEPRGLVLSGKATITVTVDDSRGPVKLVEVETEHGSQGEIEVEHALESEHGVEVENEHGREAELEHLGTLGVRHAVACAPACGAGFECDDGLCKVHDETETHLEHPAGPDDSAPGPSTGADDSAPGATPGATTSCPAGLELDASDGTCKPHGGANGSGRG